MPASLGVNRNLSTISVSAAATIGPDVDQVIADATSAGFTCTLTDFEDGALHQVEFFIDPDDSSGNNVTISGNAGAFTASLSSDGATSLIIQTQADGTWIVVADVSSTDAAAANSRAVSAGLQASTADSKAVSDSVLTSTADSKAVSNSVVISTLTTTSNSKDTSQSVLISTANSADTSQSVIISTLTTTTNSHIASLSSNLSVTTSTANSG